MKERENRVLGNSPATASNESTCSGQWVKAMRAVVAGVVAVACHSNAWSFKLSPCLRVLTYQNAQMSQEPIRRLNQCDELLPEKYRLAVHEHITLQTLLKYRRGLPFEEYGQGWKFQYMVDKPWSVNGGRKHYTHGIIFGSWWNDDPLMRTWGQGQDFVSGALATWLMTQSGRSTYYGSGPFFVPAGEHLGRLSHYGRLQHLHFMTELKHGENASTADERVKATIEKALGWMEFTYRIATGAVAPSDPLTTEMEASVQLPSIAVNHGVRNPGNVKVRTLFSRRGQTDKERDAITPDVAIGSMLHVIQDSFSPSHARRVDKMIGELTYAVLADVENYAEQNADAHGSLDVYPAWLQRLVEGGGHQYANDPVLVGAWLLAAVDSNVPWRCVKQHLLATIFAREGEATETLALDPQCSVGTAGRASFSAAR